MKNMIRKPLTRVELRMDDVHQFEAMMERRRKSRDSEEAGIEEAKEETRQERAARRNERIGYTAPTETPTYSASIPAPR